MFVKGRLPYRCTVRIRFRAALARRRSPNGLTPMRLSLPGERFNCVRAVRLRTGLDARSDFLEAS
jgi:hypothetical protein